MDRSLRPPFHPAGALPDHEILIVLFPLLVGVLCAVIVAVTWLSNRGLLPPLDRDVRLGRFVALVCAGLSLGAGAIHQAVMADHFRTWWALGIGFAVAAIFQIAWAGAYLVRPGARLALVGAIVNLAIVVVWLWSRTLGLGLGPIPATPEPVGFVDVVATLLELGLVVILAAGLVPAGAARLDRRVRFGDASIASTFCVLVIAIATVAALSGFAVPQPA